ncbi:hypothetical protein SK128_016626 [Halocaridina rubra]|uniref:Uncharacterized protein n=1 Tax=Halocaridina rubra TaxID=373956 RepID=A0AAN8WJ57_HALRR
MFERVNGVFGCRTRSTNVFDNQIPRSHVRTSLQTLVCRTAFDDPFYHSEPLPRTSKDDGTEGDSDLLDSSQIEELEEGLKTKKNPADKGDNYLKMKSKNNVDKTDDDVGKTETQRAKT